MQLIKFLYYGKEKIKKDIWKVKRYKREVKKQGLGFSGYSAC